MLGRNTRPSCGPEFAEWSSYCERRGAIRRGFARSPISLLWTPRIVQACLALAFFSLATARGGVAITGVRIDGRAVPDLAAVSSTAHVKDAAPLRIPQTTRDLEFRLAPDARDGVAPLRLRYKLEGFDKSWHEAGGEMRAELAFFDGSDQVVDRYDFPVRGESAGWSGSVNSSTSSSRKVSAIVPSRANYVAFSMVSGGGPTTTGFYAIDGVNLKIESDSGVRKAALLDADTVDDSDASTPQRWRRDGKTDLAQLWKLPSGNAKQYMLVLSDNDIQHYGVWTSFKKPYVEVHPGERIQAEWREIYSIGDGGDALANYSYLAPGNYWFRVMAANEAGAPTGVEVTLPLFVAQPWWARLWFWCVVTVALILLSTGIVRDSARRRLQRATERLAREHLLAEERARIARDIHDDLGANLAEIAMLSALACENVRDSALVKQLNEIFERSEGAVRRLGEIVWAINPANDTLDHFTSYLNSFVQDHLALARIRCRLDIPEVLPTHVFPSIKRHNLFLAVKEALHNAVRHGSPREVVLRLAVQAGVLTVAVEDDGCGFDQTAVLGSPHGTANMQQRMAQIGGTFARSSTPGVGTCVTFQLPVA